MEHKFSDEDVLDPDFKEELARVAGVARPLVYLYVCSLLAVIMIIYVSLI